MGASSKQLWLLLLLPLLLVVLPFCTVAKQTSFEWPRKSGCVPSDLRLCVPSLRSYAQFIVLTLLHVKFETNKVFVLSRAVSASNVRIDPRTLGKYILEINKNWTVRDGLEIFMINSAYIWNRNSIVFIQGNALQIRVFKGHRQ